MNFNETAKKILENVGGTKNVLSLTHCMTRIRFELKDMDVINEEKIKTLPQVIGTVKKEGIFQVIVGSDVRNIYEELISLGGFSGSNKGNNQKKKKEKKLTSVLDFVANIFSPILPAIAASGVLQAILIVLKNLNIIDAASQTYIVLNVIANCVFYFLPIYLAFSAAEKFKCNKYIAVTLACVLLHPTIMALEAPVQFLGIPMKLADYTSSVLPILLTVWLQSYVESFVAKHSPKAIKFFLVPLSVLVICAPACLLILGPIGTVVGDLLAAGLNFINRYLGWFTVMFFAGFCPILTMTGMHHSLTPILLNNLATFGYDTVIVPGAVMSNVAHGGAALAVAIKTKSKEMKKMSISTGITALLGITEPSLYGVHLKLKKPLIAVIIGGAAGGLWLGLFNVKAYTLGAGGLVAAPLFIGEGDPMNFVHGCIALAITLVVSFVATLIIGFKDVEESDVDKSIKGKTVHSPVSGEVVNLSDVADETFSSKILGDGIAVKPSEGKIYAPFDGTVTALFPTKHAIGLKSEDGKELLIHIGINTVKLDGRYFEAYVKEKDIVHEGDLLITFDLDKISAEGYDTTTSILVTNYNEFGEVMPVAEKKIKNGEPLVKVG